MKKLLFFFLLLSFVASAQIPISQLPTYTGNPAGGYLPIVIGGITRKIEASKLGGGSGAEVDPYFTTSPAVGITSTMITNWNTAYSWGNHAGLYPLMSGSYANPSWITSLDWSKITGVPTSAAAKDNSLVEPGVVSWTGSGLSFDVSPAMYYINNTLYTSPASQITLDPADPSNPRIDVIAVNDLGQVVKITGVAAVNPVEPQVDPASQVFLTSIHIAAGATTPSNISSATIYNENTEWTGSATGVTVNFNNTSNVFIGSKAADVGTWTSGNTLTFTNSGTLFASGYTTLKFYIRLKGAVAGNANIQVAFQNGSTVVSNSVNLNSSYGFTKNIVNTYQTIAIPLSAFTFSVAMFDKLKINLTGSGFGFYLDYVQLQSGITSGGTSTGITSLNGLTSSSQTFAIGTTGTDANISSASGTHTFNFPSASASNRGLLTSTDWGTFNSKQAALVSGTNIKTINGSSILGSGDLTVGGGFTNPMTTLGDVIYGGAAGAATALAGNTTATKKFLTQTGDGTNSAAPSWGTIGVSDVSGLAQPSNQILYGTGTGVTSSSNLTYNGTNLLAVTGDVNTSTGILRGGQFDNGAKIKLNGINGAGGWIDLVFSTRGTLRTAGTPVFSGAGVYDVFFQGIPETSSGAVALEAWASSQLILGTGGNSSPISFRVARTEVGQFTSTGFVSKGTGQFDNYLNLKEIAAPSTPAAGYGLVYPKSDGHIYYKNSAGTESQLDGAGGTTPGIDDVLATGQALTANRTINTTANFALSVSGAVPSTTASGTLQVTNSSATGTAIVATANSTNLTAIKGDASLGTGVTGTGVTGVLGSSTSGSGVNGTSTSSHGVFANSTSGNGLFAKSTSGKAADFVINPTSTNTVAEVLRVERQTSGTAANGIGGSIDLYSQISDFSTRLANQLVWKWLNATLATRTSELTITGVNAGTTVDVLSLGGAGYVKLNGITATAASALTASAGMVVFVNSTNGTFTSVGFWGYDGTAWNKF